MEEKKEQIGRGMNWISLSSPLRSCRSLVALSFQSFVHKFFINNDTETLIFNIPQWWQINTFHRNKIRSVNLKTVSID